MNTHNKFELEIWIGLATLKPIGKHGHEILNGAEEAFVNVLGLSRNKNDFRKKIKTAAMNLELYLMRLEESEPLFGRIQKYKVDNELMKMANQLMKNDRIKFGKFHTYKTE